MTAKKVTSKFLRELKIKRFITYGSGGGHFDHVGGNFACHAHLFLIRDDDTCAFTNPDQLEKCYGDVWGQIPVGLAVTPFRIPGKFPDIPESLRDSPDPQPLESNREIVILETPNRLATSACDAPNTNMPNAFSRLELSSRNIKISKNDGKC